MQIIKKVFILLWPVISTEAHMKLNTPTPYGQSTLNNAPLDSSGLDFPCKQRPGVYNSEGASNIYALGSTNPLKFTGQAVHGGGSCQISITYDSKPDKNTSWKVIASIEGGCPAQGQIGNMGDDDQAQDPYSYNFTIPFDIPNGNGTIAWTWFNKIGNREMYMNCAPMILTGIGGSHSNFDRLPNMFIAHIGNGCGVNETYDVLFPNPGKYLQRLNGVTTKFITPFGNCGPTIFESVIMPSIQADNISTSFTAPISLSTPSITTPTTGPTSSSQSNSVSVAPLECFEEGEWKCINGSSIQRCASGTWSVVQHLSLGVHCEPGQSSALTLLY